MDFRVRDLMIQVLPAADEPKKPEDDCPNWSCGCTCSCVTTCSECTNCSMVTPPPKAIEADYRELLLLQTELRQALAHIPHGTDGPSETVRL